MSDFPLLRTGAVIQYPAQKTIEFRTQIVRFVDGSEQRFRDYKSPIRRWTIRLDMLDESELHGLREFFRSQSGGAVSFTFVDPWDGTSYPSCTFEDEAIADELLDEMKGKIAFTVRESRE